MKSQESLWEKLNQIIPAFHLKKRKVKPFSQKQSSTETAICYSVCHKKLEILRWWVVIIAFAVFQAETNQDTNWTVLEISLIFNFIKKIKNLNW